MGYYTRLALLVIVGLIVLSPHIVHLVQEREITFSEDEAYQLLAVRNMLEGAMYSFEFPDKDLSAPTSYRHMYEWPPGFSFTIYFLKKIGFSLLGAALFFKIFFVLLGVVAWSYVGEKILRNYILLMIFVIILPGMMIFNPTDLFCWAITPGILLCWQNSTFKKEVVDYRYLMGASSLVAVIILYKYSVVFFILAGILFYILDGALRNKLFWKQALVFSVLPIVTYFSIHIFNKTHSLAFAFASGMTFSPDFGFSSYLAPLKSVFMIPFELNQFFTFLGSQNGASDLYVMPFVLFFTALLVYYWIRQIRNQGFILIWSTLAISSIIVFLMLDIFSFSSIGFHSSEHYRYYSVVSPLFVVLILSASGWVFMDDASILPTKWVYKENPTLLPKLLVTCSMFLLLMFPFGYSAGNLIGMLGGSKNVYHMEGDTLIALTESITGKGDISPQKHFGHVKYFTKISEMKVLGLPREEVSLDGTQDSRFWKDAYCSNPTWIFLYEYRPLKDYYYNKQIRKLSKRLGLKTRQTDNWVVHYKKLPKGDLPG
ncbi:MAG: hypothetical protein HN356_03620 [Calditrichaeota bacterium]|jgi:hypothetical protein|nr:hypothetical protein [Calditrichota bacterium]MBT7618141.1 hypothetical protein [Calditrichota bacterium]MBT7787494.1 hypothetical protein [Calditrichota bacterium]